MELEVIPDFLGAFSTRMYFCLLPRQGKGLAHAQYRNNFRVGLVRCTVIMASFRPAARRYHAAVGAGQTMLVWGGRGEGIQTSTVESFDVTSLTWKEPRQLQGDLPIALASVAVASDGEKAYMFGGLSSRGLENKLFSLDLASLECRELVPSSTPRPSGREHCRMVCCGGKLVVYGGFSGSVIGASDDLYTFDLTSGTESVSLPNIVSYVAVSIIHAIHTCVPYVYGSAQLIGSKCSLVVCPILKGLGEITSNTCGVCSNRACLSA